jgi:K+-transporting ATPase ATPase C chain
MAGSLSDRPIPVDLLTSSGSGLDPDISVAAALYQLAHIAHLHGLGESAVRALWMNIPSDLRSASWASRV